MSKKQKQGKTRKIFNRITLTIVLGLFLLLLATMALTTAIMPFIAGWWSVSEDNVIVFGVTILAVSIVIGVGFSFAYSAFMLKATKPYLEALQKIADCDFSVRIKDSVLFSGFGVAENFNEMANRLESVETLRDDFVSNFSHEFKTPIASISGFATLLKTPICRKRTGRSTSTSSLTNPTDLSVWRKAFCSCPDWIRNPSSRKISFWTSSCAVVCCCLKRHATSKR